MYDNVKSPTTPGESFIIYKRVSTPDQQHSLAVQDLTDRRFVSEARGYVVLVLEDVGTGARVFNREGYQTLLKCIRERKAQNVVVRDLSRFGRNLQHLMYLFNLAKQNNVKLWDVQLGRITEMEMMALGMISQMQLTVLGFQVKEALFARVLKHLRAGGRVYGYDVVEKNGEKGHLVIVDSDATIIRRIYNMAEKGLSERSIVRIFNGERIPSPLGKKWGKKTVSNILGNEIYKASILYNRTHTYFQVDGEIRVTERRPESEWLRNQGAHEPIITAEQFEKVQSIRSARHRAPFKPKKTGPPFFLSGRIKCGCCSTLDENGCLISGGTMAVCGADGRGPRLRCAGADELKCVNGRTHYRRDVLRTILSGLVEVLQDPTTPRLMVEARNRSLKLRREEARGELCKKKVELEKLDRRINRLIDTIESGREGAPEIRSRLAKRSLEKADLIACIADLEHLPDELKFNAHPIEEFLSAAKAMIDQLAVSPSEPMDVSLEVHLESLISFVLLTPNPEGRGFSVEVHGDLAVLVSGKRSSKKDFRKSCRRTGTRKPTTLMNRQPDSVAIVELFKRGFPNVPVDNRSDVERLLEGRTEPMTATAVACALKTSGIVCSASNAANKMAKKPLTFVHVRRNGFMLRSVWESLPQKYFLNTQHIIDLASEACVKSDRPLRPDHIIEYFRSCGYTIAGNANSVLRDVLASNNHVFRAHGRNTACWSLRAKPRLS